MPGAIKWKLSGSGSIAKRRCEAAQTAVQTAQRKRADLHLQLSDIERELSALNRQPSTARWSAGRL